MRTKVTLVLLLLNVVLFFFIFTFVHRWRTDTLWEESRTRVLGPEAATIQSLEIAGRPPCRASPHGEEAGGLDDHRNPPSGPPILMPSPGSSMS